MTSLTNRALLVTLSIRQWSARKYDKRETAAVAMRHGIDSNVARVNKHLLPASDALQRVQQKASEARTFYYKNTLPWGQEGVQIIKTDAYFDFARAMRHHADEWHRLVDDFVLEYPALRVAAEDNLGDLYDEADYPSSAAIADKFSMRYQFMPVPDQADWRVDLGDDEMEVLRQSITQQVIDAQAVAMKEAWARVYDVVSKAHERLADPAAIFRNSLVENAAELCELLPRLNIANDPGLDSMRVELERSLCKYTPDTLRSAPDVREDVAAKMADLMNKMGAYMK